jgi:hypothetical protein
MPTPGIVLKCGLCIAIGVVLVIAARRPQRNSVTKLFYDLFTLFPTFGYHLHRMVEIARERNRSPVLFLLVLVTESLS